MTLVVFGVVLALTNPKGDGVFPWLAILAILLVISVVTPRWVERPLDCASANALAGSYRTRFFLRVAFAESVALFGFAFAFVGGAAWIYFLGAAFALIRFWTGIAPTRSALANDQHILNEWGCELSLVASLRGIAPDTT